VSARQVREFPSFGDLPVLVVSASRSGVLFDQQRRLLDISSASQLMHIDADHMGMLLDQSHAANIVEMIDAFIDSSK
jgi:hypothetical protein